VVLKTLGATRMRIVRTFSVEFSVLGLLAGSVGVVFANLLTRVLLQAGSGFHIEWTATLIALVGRRCWPRRRAGLRATGFSGCGRWKCCARRQSDWLVTRLTDDCARRSRSYPTALWILTG
jgi:predicted lysophospholipase L1 biosynthesis ABC-type transport system permease subunit